MNNTLEIDKRIEDLFKMVDIVQSLNIWLFSFFIGISLFYLVIDLIRRRKFQNDYNNLQLKLIEIDEKSFENKLFKSYLFRIISDLILTTELFSKVAIKESKAKDLLIGKFVSLTYELNLLSDNDNKIKQSLQYLHENGDEKCLDYLNYLEYKIKNSQNVDDKIKTMDFINDVKNEIRYKKWVNQ